MTLLAHQICRNHPAREAAARCVECTNFFCRECIAEHDGRLICAGCLARLGQAAPAAVRAWPGTVRHVASAALGLLGAWLCFYALGRTLLTLPSEFHARKWWHEMVNSSESDE